VSLLNQRFEHRWQNLRKRSKRLELPLPPKETLRKLLYKSFYIDGFRCEYCNIPLKINDEYPYYRIFSFEHKQPLDKGGDNSIENLAIVCHRCNIVKGPITENTFRQIIKFLPSDVFDKMCNEMFSGRMSAKLSNQGLTSLDAQLWNLSADFIPPTCPICNSILTGILDSKNLVCSKCRKQFTIVKISEKEPFLEAHS